MSDSRLFCFGYGYTADFLARKLREKGGWTIAGTTRDMVKRQALRGKGIDAYTFDTDKPLGDPNLILRDVTHLLISTPPDQDGDLVYHMHGDDIARMPNLRWIGYISTTGVYGDRDGGMVDETTELRPSSIRGSRRVRAEGDWNGAHLYDGLPVHVFRLAGIYGPWRSAIDSVRAGIARRIMKPGHAFSRIHVEDIANTLIASFDNPNPGRSYNVVDDEAAPSHEVIAYACRLLGKDLPPLVQFDEANLSPMSLSFYSENKRLSNARIKSELGVTLKYPNYRVGLEACLEAEKANETLSWDMDGSENTGGGF